MGRSDYKYFVQSDFSGGINQDPETAQANEVLDARNMWAPYGRAEQRPGYVGVWFPGSTNSTSSTSVSLYFTSNTAILDSPDGGAPNLTGNFYSLANGNSLAWNAASTVNAISLSNFASGAGDYVKGEYWNGAAWTYLPLVLSSYAFGTDKILLYVPPKDLTTTTIGGITLSTRLRLQGSSTTIFNNDVSVKQTYLTTGHSLGAFVAAFPTTTKWVTITLRNATGFSRVSTYNQGFVPSAVTTYTYASYNFTDTSLQSFFWENSYAILPEFGEVYFPIADRIYSVNLTDSNQTKALIETRPEFVGTLNGVKAPYHQDYVAQAGAFPSGSYITWFQNQLFIAALSENKFAFRWSAPTDATLVGYKVWPDESYDVLAEDDNSPITGLSSLSEHLIIFKRNSVWRVVLLGQNDLGLNQYQPIKITSGVGCVANASIVRTPRGLVFLSSDGIYLFDGNQVVKISERLDQFTKTINPHTATATHWQSRNCVLLSVAINGAAVNNAVIVWDYKHDAWWVWDNIEAISWFQESNVAGVEQLFFMDSAQYVYQFDSGATNYGATISSYLTTHRFGYDGIETNTFREISVDGTNDITSATITPIPNDRDSPTAMTLSMVDSAETLLSSTTFSSSTFSERKRRNRRVSIRLTGQWCQVKVANSTKNQPMKISRIALGYVPLGRR